MMEWHNGMALRPVASVAGGLGERRRHLPEAERVALRRRRAAVCHEVRGRVTEGRTTRTVIPYHVNAILA
jgi:hypothetical protein